MNREDSIVSVLSQIWGSSKGYVKFARKYRPTDAGLVDQTWFAWPDDRLLIRRHVERWQDTPNLFFTPYVFRTRSATYAADPDNIVTRDRLCIDLDAVDPRKLPKELEPSFAWCTSPRRFQAVWALDRPLSNGAAVIGHAVSLALHVGATDGATAGQPKFMRVPMTRHLKPANDTHDGQRRRGKVLWPVEGDLFEVVSTDDLPSPIRPHRPVIGGVSTGPADRDAALAMLPPGIRWRVKSDDVGGDRSQFRYVVTDAGLKAGLSPAQIVSVLTGTSADCYDLPSDVARIVGKKGGAR
mgnify:CR=1 FL=1